MTISINLPDIADARLRDNAEKAGISPDRLAEQILMSQLVSQSERIEHLIAGLAALADPSVDLVDVSREGIYAD